jgi:hypothetical protein
MDVSVEFKPVSKRAASNALLSWCFKLDYCLEEHRAVFIEEMTADDVVLHCDVCHRSFGMSRGMYEKFVNPADKDKIVEYSLSR